MGIFWSFRRTPEDEEEFPFSFLNRSPHYTAYRNYHSNNSISTSNRSNVDIRIPGSSWTWRDLLPMATDDVGGSNGGNGNITNRPSIESGDDDRDDESFATLLSSLIRSGQVRLITSDSLYTADDDSVGVDDISGNVSGSDQESDINRTRKHMQTIIEESHDKLKFSDIKTIVELDTGQFSSCKRSAAGRRNILNRIRGREYGSLNRGTPSALSGNLTQGDKCHIGTRMLPDLMSKVDTYRSKVFCGQYTKDGRVLITACQDQRIRFYDMANVMDAGYIRKTSGPPLRSSAPFHSVEAKDVGWSILDVAVSPDGRHAIYSSWSDYIHQCDIYENGDTNHVAFHLHPGEERFCIFSLRFSTDGNEILAGASDQCLYVYDRERKTRTLKIKAHEDDVNSVCFADDTSQIIYSGGDDGLCKVWDRRTLNEDDPKPVGVLAGHLDGITFIDSKGDARYLISNSKDQSIKLWDIRKFSNETGMQATRAAVSKQGWDYRWQSVPRKVLTYHRLDGDTSIMTYRNYHTVLHTLIRCFFSPAFTTGQRYVYTGCATGACVVYDLLTGEVVKRLKGHHACVRDVSWHPYRNEICTSSWDAVVARWTFDGRDDSDFEYDYDDDFSCSDDYSDGEEIVRGRNRAGASSNTQTIAGRLVRLYRHRQAPLRRSERLRQERRRVNSIR